MVKRNEYKRAQCPPIIKISKKLSDTVENILLIMTIITDSDLHDSLCQICIESPHSLLSELGYAAKQKNYRNNSLHFL